MKDDEALNVLYKVLKDNNIEPNNVMIQRFENYYSYLVEYNQNVNLTAITERCAVYLKHFADSAVFSSAYNVGAHVCDIGTGAGFPGVVLKIIRPDLKLTLVDSLNKRITFLNELIVRLGLTDVTCLHYRAEDIEFKEKYLNSFDYVIARAVASMPTLTEYCLPYVKVGGQFIAYKSGNVNTELNQAKKCIEILGGKFNRCENYNVNNEIARTIVVIDKYNKTSAKYPRGQNKPRLKPIL
ncbi:MAG TPA: 16S rRNA (guanine(527)-N(7))-methyltransferase RsmG [Clostridiales bacterium]|nr:16S rRNA (guanine(527)-N(7))-methyltransferase RsmG [Clostridiales bacterium]